MRTLILLLSTLFIAAALQVAPASACPAGYRPCGGDLCCPAQ